MLLSLLRLVLVFFKGRDVPCVVPDSDVPLFSSASVVSDLRYGQRWWVASVSPLAGSQADLWSRTHTGCRGAKLRSELILVSPRTGASGVVR